MKKSVLIFFVLCLILSPIICFPEDSSYTKYLVDDQGHKILELSVEYIGKEPLGVFDWQDEINWKEKKLDFYNIQWVNLTDHPIIFIRSKSWRKSGRGTTQYRRLPDGEKEVVKIHFVNIREYAEKPRKDGNTIEPYGTQLTDNAFLGISGKLNYDVVYFETTIRFLGKEHTLPWYMVGTR